MVLRLKVRICRGGRCVETIGIANTGFSGREPEITLSLDIAREVLGDKPRTIVVERVLADGSRVMLARSEDPLDLYLVAEDRVVGPVKVYAYIVRSGFTLLNDATLSALKIVILDPKEGVWCFRDELGRYERRGL